jgi:EEF1A lysine methyltransferase 4
MEKNSQYKCLDYWNQRYDKEESFEWFGEYAKYKDIIKMQISTNDRILVLGMEINTFSDIFLNFIQMSILCQRLW